MHVRCTDMWMYVLCAHTRKPPPSPTPTPTPPPPPPPPHTPPTPTPHTHIFRIQPPSGGPETVYIYKRRHNGRHNIIPIHGNTSLHTYTWQYIVTYEQNRSDHYI